MSNAERRKRYYRKHRARVLAAHKIWAAKRRPSRARYAQAFRYGLTVQQLNALTESQEGRCAICAVTHENLTVDHNHETGKVRGLLCASCNKGLGFFGDRIDLLMQAINYLKGEQNAL